MTNPTKTTNPSVPSTLTIAAPLVNGDVTFNTHIDTLNITYNAAAHHGGHGVPAHPSHARHHHKPVGDGITKTVDANEADKGSVTYTAPNGAHVKLTRYNDHIDSELTDAQGTTHTRSDKIGFTGSGHPERHIVWGEPQIHRQVEAALPSSLLNTQSILGIFPNPLGASVSCGDKSVPAYDNQIDEATRDRIQDFAKRNPALAAHVKNDTQQPVALVGGVSASLATVLESESGYRACPATRPLVLERTKVHI